MDTHGGQGTITLDPRHRIRDENKCRTRVATAVLSRLVTKWADTDSVDDETDVNSADLQGIVRSKLEALSAGIDDFPSDLSSVFTQEESSKVGECGNEFVLCPGNVGNHPCSPRQDEGQERRQK